MDMDNCIKCRTISNHEIGNISNMCFDGSHYYFLIHNKNLIIMTNLELHVVHRYETCMRYSNICFDWKEHCFWAVSSENCNTIYKCNCRMKEVGMIRLHGYPEGRNAITGISYNCCRDNLILSYNGIVIQVDKSTGRYELCFRFRNGTITSVLGLCPGYVISARNGEKQSICVVKADTTLTELCSLCTSDVILNVIFHPKGECCEIETLELLMKKGRDCSYIRSIPITECQLNFEICECNFEICGNSCIGSGSSCECCYDVIESIALIEAAIAHILNAEGEKIQKAVKVSDDIDTMLCVNQSVNDTIINITSLEHVLYSKLVTAYKLCTYVEESGCNCRNSKEYFGKENRKELDVVKYLHDNILGDV